MASAQFALILGLLSGDVCAEAESDPASSTSTDQAMHPSRAVAEK